MKKLNKRGRIRLFTGITVFVILFIAMLFVFFSRGSGAWFTQKEDAQAVYNMGVVKLDGPDNIQYNIKELNFAASTMLRGTAEDDENFNSCVFVAHGEIQNLSTVPITLDFAIDKAFVSETDSSNARPNPGLMYSLFYCESNPAAGSREEVALKLLKKDKDFKKYFNELKGFTQVGAGEDNSIIPHYVNDSLPKQPITIAPAQDGKNVTYEMYWIFWVDHERALEAVPGLQSNDYQALVNQYGITINMRARQVSAPVE